MQTFITLWFSSMTLLGPATNYDVRGDAKTLAIDANAASVMDSTTTVGNYMDSLARFETVSDGEIAKKTVYQVVEQNLILGTKGEVLFLGTKFLAPLQWMVTSSTEGYAGFKNHYTVNSSSSALLTATLKRASSTKEKYRIYRGERYLVKDRIDFSFKKQ